MTPLRGRSTINRDSRSDSELAGPRAALADGDPMKDRVALLAITCLGFLAPAAVATRSADAAVGIRVRDDGTERGAE
jgi:hypothetical protein